MRTIYLLTPLLLLAGCASTPSVQSNSGGTEHVLETDSPYLAPLPYRGKRNEPAFMSETVDRLCELLVCDRVELLAKTSANARELLSL